MKSTILKFVVIWLAATTSSPGFAQRAGLKTNLLYDATTTIHLGYETALSRNLTLDVWVNYNPWVLGHKWVGLHESEVNNNASAFERESRLQHLMIQPEVRWWLCEKFNGHFFGVHLHGGTFNVGALKLPFDWGRYGSVDSRGQFSYLGEFPTEMTPVGNEGLKVQGIAYHRGTQAYPGLGKTPGTIEESNDIFYGNADRDGIYINNFDGWFMGAGVSYGYHWVVSRRLSLEFTIGAGYAYLDMEKSRCTTCKKKLGDEKVHYFGPTRAGVSLVYMLK